MPVNVLANGSEELGVREEVLDHRHDRRLVVQNLVVVLLEIQSGRVEVGVGGPPEEVHLHLLMVGPNLDCREPDVGTLLEADINLDTREE